MSAAVLVTGATGFLGREIVRNLVARGRVVHALARTTSRRAPLADLDLIWHEGDLTQRETLERAARAAGPGAQLVHAAAVISYKSADRALLREVNVEGTQRLLDVAKEVGFSRVLHVSSIVAVGCARGAEALDEASAWSGGGLSAYADTKRAAEEIALGALGLDVRVVCPGAIFGPDPSTNTSIFLKRLIEGHLGGWVAPGSLSVVGVHDTAEGVCLALERGERGRRYLLVDRTFRLAELCRIAAVELGTFGRTVRVPRTVPAPVWPAVVGCARLIDRVRPLAELTPQALAMLGVNWRGRADRARRELGWRPQPFESVLRETLRALLGEGEG